MLALNDAVIVPTIESGRVRMVQGIVVGRTLEQSPRYDVRLPDGRMVRDVAHSEAERVEGEAA